MITFTRLCANVTPVRAVFFGSLIMSVIALGTSPAINRDGMLYVDAARAFQNGGLAAANSVFNWPFLPILMAAMAKMTGLGLEESGYLLNALFLAGSLALIVDCTKRAFPEAGWAICLVLLSLPAMNHYREEILREYGCWFFVSLSFWLAIRWSDSLAIGLALAAQFSIATAALFRPEAIAFFPALALWQFFSAPEHQKWRRTATMLGLPLAGIVLLTLLLASGYLESARLAAEIERINVTRFDQKAQVLASALIPYARDQAKTILFLGSIALIPLKFVKQLGVFLIPLLFVFSRITLRQVFVRLQPFSWAFLAHVVVLAIFVLDLQFLAGRYVAVLQLMLAPAIGYGAWLLVDRFPKLKQVLILLAVAIAISNVLSFAPKKTQYRDAGAWLAANAKESPRIYIESALVTHYAGWRLLREAPQSDRSWLPGAIDENKYDLLVFETKANDRDLGPWLASNGLSTIRKFGPVNGSAITIAAPTGKRHTDGTTATDQAPP